MARSNFSKGVIAVLSIFALASGIFKINFGSSIYIGAESRSLEEVIRELEEKQKEKGEKEKLLKEIEEKIASLGNRTGTLENQILQVQHDIEVVNEELKKCEEEIRKNEEDIEIISEELERNRDKLKEMATILYQFSQISTLELVFMSGDMSSFLITNEIQTQNLEKCKEEILRLENEFKKLEELKNVLDEEKAPFERTAKDLEEEKKKLENELTDARLQMALNTSQAGVLRGQIIQLQSAIDLLEEEQKKILEKEQQQLLQGGNGGNEPLEPGDYYFRSRGRDLYDGHGVGMSQWGAYGMAQAGKNYQQILTFYYTGTNIGTTSVSSIPVVGYGYMDLEHYVAGLGEVPDKACGTEEQALSNPQKYVVDNPDSVWDCWPEEAIKAQIVAARTYAIYYTHNGSGPAICTTAACQVYKGGEGKRWAVNETARQVVLYNGSPIGAFYHASARGHTEGNEYVWTANKYGAIGYARPYLRGVDDSAWAYRNSYYDWITRTNGYSLEEWSSILASNEDTNVGMLISITIERGSSNRAWRVHLHGTKGNKTVAGWYFKAIYNNWVYNNKPPDKRDYIYSTEFFFLRAE